MDRRSFLALLDPERDLPDIAPEDNPMVWCERCRKHHRQYTFTRADWHTVRDEAVDKLAAAIDADALAAAQLAIEEYDFRVDEAMKGLKRGTS